MSKSFENGCITKSTSTRPLLNLIFIKYPNENARSKTIMTAITMISVIKIDVLSSEVGKRVVESNVEVSIVEISKVEVEVGICHNRYPSVVL